MAIPFAHVELRHGPVRGISGAAGVEVSPEHVKAAVQQSSKIAPVARKERESCMFHNVKCGHWSGAGFFTELNSIRLTCQQHVVPTLTRQPPIWAGEQIRPAVRRNERNRH
jgi:hypothetical protein